MPTFRTTDDVEIWFKDWGPKDGPAVILSHGWPLNADSWDGQALALAEAGFRVVAHDRRGHGRSSQPWDGNDMDHYADDLAQLIGHLGLARVSLFGFSTGGGEVARYVGRHGTGRVDKLGLISAVTPFLMRGPDNPDGAPPEAFDGIRAACRADRSAFYRDLAANAFFGFNRPGATPSEGMIDAFWMQGMMSGHKNAYDCIAAFSASDFRADLARFDRPTLIVHGSDDQVVPVAISAEAAARAVRGSVLKVYDGAPHGLTDTHKDRLSADMVAFLKV